MSAEYNRDELGSQIKESYDKNIPDDYARRRLLSDIEERYETEDGKHTIMENMFRIRYVCIVSIMFILLIVLPGGTYTAVSMMNNGAGSEETDDKNTEPDKDNESGHGNGDNDNEEVTGEEHLEELRQQEQARKERIEKYSVVSPDGYKAVLLRVFSGDYDESIVEVSYDWSTMGANAYDGRLEAALRDCNTEYDEVTTPDGVCKYVMLGVFGGVGLSDRVFDKNLYRIYAAYAYEILKPDDDNSFAYMYNTGITSGTEDIIYSVQINNTYYCISDITDYCINRIKHGYIQFEYAYNRDSSEWGKDGDGNIDDSGTYGYMPGKKIYVTDYYINEAKKSLEQKNTEYSCTLDPDALKEMKNGIVCKYNDSVRSYDIPEDGRGVFASEYPNEISSDDNRYYLRDGFCDIEELVKAKDYKYGLDYYIYSEKRKNYVDTSPSGKVFCSLEGLRLEDMSGDSSDKTITITVENADICRKKTASAEDEKTYLSLGALGSTVNTYKAHDANDRYTVYLNCGNSITIPYDGQDTLKDYGIYIESSWIDIPEKNMKTSDITDFDVVIDWYSYYMNSHVGVSVSVNSDGGYERKNIMIKSIPYLDTSYNLKYRIMYGWEQD